VADYREDGLKGRLIKPYQFQELQQVINQVLE